jgi:hypothetical protein
MLLRTPRLKPKYLQVCSVAELSAAYLSALLSFLACLEGPLATPRSAWHPRCTGDRSTRRRSSAQRGVPTARTSAVISSIQHHRQGALPGAPGGRKEVGAWYGWEEWARFGAAACGVRLDIPNTYICKDISGPRLALPASYPLGRYSARLVRHLWRVRLTQKSRLLAS